MLNFNDIVTIVNEIRSYSKCKSIKLYTITNGTILTDEMLFFFFENRDLIDLNFSLDGYKEIHELNRPYYNETMKNILKYEKVFGYKPIINAVVTKRTIENKDEVVDFFLKNNFNKVNFSIIFGTDDKLLSISNKTYNNFIDYCNEKGLLMRQKSNEKKFDCSKYGNLCGVGRNNVFITKSGIYPCSRFLGDNNHVLSGFEADFFEVEKNLQTYKKPRDGECYFEKYFLGGR